MHYLKDLPRLLLTLPNTIRIGLFISSMVLFLGIHLLTYPASHNGSLLLIPGILGAWMFKRPGILVGIAVEVPVMVIYHSVRLKTIWWPFPMFVFFWGGCLIALLICIIVVNARKLVDSSEEARKQVAIAYDQQVHLNQIKEEFVLNVSHELRTPVTVLGNCLEILLEHHDQLDPEKQAEVLTLAMENHEELVNLINRVLDTMAVSGEFPPAQCGVVSVYQFVQEVLAHFNSQETQSYTFHIDVPEQIMVWADPQYLSQVLRNLLGNVCKYVPRQTEIHIEATQPTSSSPVCLTMQDAGPGIPPEELPYLFEKFVRLKRNVAGSVPGTGLGLYICKQLIEAMGGRIWVESSGRVGEGSRFCLSLPSSPPSSPI